MIVSNFALAYCPEQGTVRHAKYTLQITNLEEQEIEFAIECHVGDNFPTWYLNEAVRRDIESASAGVKTMPFRTVSNFRVARMFFRIRGKRSALFELSRVFKKNPDTSEIRGFIVLRVPLASNLAQRYFRQPQTGHPVKVLLHARREDRRDIFPTRETIPETGSSLYASEAIAISTGRAENDLEPEGGSVLTAGIIRDLQTRWAAGRLNADELVGARNLEENEQAAKLVDLLLALRADTDDLEALNQLLTACDAEVRVGRTPSSSRRRKPK